MSCRLSSFASQSHAHISSPSGRLTNRSNIQRFFPSPLVSSAEILRTAPWSIAAERRPDWRKTKTFHLPHFFPLLFHLFISFQSCQFSLPPLQISPSLSLGSHRPVSASTPPFVARRSSRFIPFQLDKSRMSSLIGMILLGLTVIYVGRNLFSLWLDFNRSIASIGSVVRFASFPRF